MVTDGIAEETVLDGAGVIARVAPLQIGQDEVAAGLVSAGLGLAAQLARPVRYRFPVEGPIGLDGSAERPAWQIQAGFPRLDHSPSERADGHIVGCGRQSPAAYQQVSRKRDGPAGRISDDDPIFTFKVGRIAENFGLFPDADSVGGRQPDFVEGRRLRRRSRQGLDFVISLRAGHRVALDVAIPVTSAASSGSE